MDSGKSVRNLIWPPGVPLTDNSREADEESRYRKWLACRKIEVLRSIRHHLYWLKAENEASLIVWTEKSIDSHRLLAQIEGHRIEARIILTETYYFAGLNPRTLTDRLREASHHQSPVRKEKKGIVSMRSQS